MRTILVMAALMLSQTVFAGVYTNELPPDLSWPETTMLAEGSVSLTPIAGEIVGRKSLCPKGKICIQDGTILKVRFRLGGCMDTLSNVTTSVDYQSRTVYVSAQRVGNEKSWSTMCLVEPTTVVPVTVYGLKGKFDVRFVGTEENPVY